MTSNTAAPAAATMTLEAALKLATTHHQANRLAEAEQLYRAILQAQPAQVDATYNLGILACQVGQHAAGLPYLKAALAARPDVVMYLLTYVEVLAETGHARDALAQLQQAMSRGLNTPAAHTLLKKVEAALHTPLQISAGPTDSQLKALAALFEQKKYVEAEQSARTLTQQYPQIGFTWKALGAALQKQGQQDLPILSKAVELLPDDAEAHNNLGNALHADGQTDAAMASFERALVLKPDFAEAHGNLGISQKMAGQFAKAKSSYLRCMAIKPDLLYVRSHLLFLLTSTPEGGEPSEIFAEYRAFSEILERPFKGKFAPHTNARDAQRPLKVGFVSGDMRSHPLINFFEPVVEKLASNPQLALCVYSNHPTEDAVTVRLKGYAPLWRNVVDLSDDTMAEQVRQDGIDVLIDLSGHTDLNRLAVFARKPAPLQMSWMGYPTTTGLQAMDYYLSDAFFLPAGQFDAQFTEKIVRLPASAPFLPAPDSPPVGPLPALKNGHITFGSFNRTNKISREVVALWAQLLRAVPSARMAMGAMQNNQQHKLFTQWFADEGVGAERLTFYPGSHLKDYLALHHHIDICLDTFPYNGGTTTLHALWMGVPTLTLAGATAAGRTGTAILSHAGLQSFVAHSPEAFVQQGAALAGDVEALQRIRAGLRHTFEQSAMGQPAVIAAGLYLALRQAWQRWCAGLPPTSFDVTHDEAKRLLAESAP